MAASLEWVSPEEAWEIFRRTLRPMGRESLKVLRCCGRVLARDVASPWDLPPEDTAVMDGYAVAAQDASDGSPLRIVGDVRIDKPWKLELGPGETVRVVTGAPLPAGANAVLPVEDAKEGPKGVLRGSMRISTGANVARRAAFGRRDDILLKAGERLGPEALAILASVGIDKVSVVKRPRLRVVPTGSELVAPGGPRQRGGVFASHGPYVRFLVEGLGGRAVVEGPVPDDVARIRESVARTRGEQLLVTTGGTGKGQGDLIFRAMEELGARVLFKGVRMRPGASIALFDAGGIPVLALPGGIGGVEVGFEVFLRPGLMYLLSRGKWEIRWTECALMEDLRPDPEAWRFVEARVWADGGRLYAVPTRRRPRGWGVPSACAHWWIELPPGKGEIPKGSLVRVRGRAFGDPLAGCDLAKSDPEEGP